MTKLLLCDLDGTLRRSRTGERFFKNPQDQALLPNVKQRLDDYASTGWVIHGITNQGGVEKGYKTYDTCVEEQEFFLTLYPLKSVLFCPDYSGNECTEVFPDGTLSSPSITHHELCGTFRKPGAGMLRYLLLQHQAHPSDCLMVGDRPEDCQAAKLAGVPFMWAGDWRNG